MTTEQDLARIAAALERLADALAPARPGLPDFNAAAAFVWRPGKAGFRAIAHPARMPLDLILGVDGQRDALLANTRHFAAGAPANNALLWGVRGAGKSALVKAIHASVAETNPALKLIELEREDLPRLDDLLAALESAPIRAIVFIDDLGFEEGDEHQRALKPVLEGGVAGRPRNVIVYATSNRRHLVARDPRENAPNDLLWSDTAEERLSLADRFGLWLGFHAIDQDLYLDIVRAYAKRLGLDAKDIEKNALQWSLERGARSGRTAWQFILDLAAAQGKKAEF
jgi:predicted AAA+ superfamily ATPase